MTLALNQRTTNDLCTRPIFGRVHAKVIFRGDVQHVMHVILFMHIYTSVDAKHHGASLSDSGM